MRIVYQPDMALINGTKEYQSSNIEDNKELLDKYKSNRPKVKSPKAPKFIYTLSYRKIKK